MHLSDRDLLTIWEEGMSQSLIEKSLRLIVRVFDNLDLTAAASLSIGNRDARLFQIRKMLFGSKLLNSATCMNCTEKVEWQMLVSDLELQAIKSEDVTKQIDIPMPAGKWRMRLPNSLDIIAVLDLPELAIQTNTIIHRCLLEPKHTLAKVASFSNAHKAALLKNMETQDPQANIEIGLSCPACEHSWSVLFDIMSYVWTEIDQYARKLLQDIYKLAYHLGWSEEAILNMSRSRRNWYLHMLPV